MAKDAKGHGSDGKGGSSYARQAPTKNGRARMYGTSMADRIKIAQDQQNIKEGRAAGSSGDPLGTGLSPRDVLAMRNAETTRRVAAALASGPKSAPVPVHDSMSNGKIDYAHNPLGLSRSEVNSDGIPNINRRGYGRIASDPTFERSPLTGENTGRRN